MMNTDNIRKIYKRFRFLNKNIMPSIDCGDGWYTLLYNMCKDLKSVNPPNEFMITKIAEKYGDLEVHTKNGNMRTRVILDQYSTKSMEICDECGNAKDLEMCDKCKVPEVDYSSQDEGEIEDINSQSDSCGDSCASGST
jgi:hypothetical protein